METLGPGPPSPMSSGRAGGCRSPASLGWAVCAGSGGNPAGCFLFKPTCSGTVSVIVNPQFFSRKKSFIGIFPTRSTPHHTDCRPTERDGWHLPLLFYSHVNLPWCGAGFSTNRLAILPYPSIFEVSAALPAVREL